MSVLGLQTSQLLIRTNLGYGTVLTAACARQGCSATGYYDYDYYGNKHARAKHDVVVADVRNPSTSNFSSNIGPNATNSARTPFFSCKVSRIL
jgi:hypothetical protein